MYKNTLKEDLIRVVEDLDGTVESTDTIAKLKTKIENSSTFESDPDFVKTLIKNCIDERVSRNERYLEKQKIELAKLQLAQLEKEIELQTAKNEALSLNPAAKVEEKQFETNIENMIKSIKTLSLPETATHIGIREAEDWFRPIDLVKECDIYISSRSGSRKETPIACGYTQDPFKNRPRNYKPKDLYDVRKIGLHEGPNTTSTAADHMKIFSSGPHGSTAADSVQSGWPVVGSNRSRERQRCLRAQAQLSETKTETLGH
ncbi:hypothetical protein TNCV_4863621 [Trichonephila clavipes]|nr:hypothetical protein TNCV_4863621 [Trichonephila clavipes]